MYKLARCQISGVKDYMMPKQTGDYRRGIIEVRYSGQQFFNKWCCGNFQSNSCLGDHSLVEI